MVNNDLKFVKLIDLCIKKPEYGSGSKAALEFNSELPRYVRITDINKQGYLKNENFVSPQIVEEKYFLEENDLLFARSGSVGKTYLYNKHDGLCQFAGYLIRFKLNPELILPEFMFFYTKSKYYWNWIETQKKTVTISNINAKQYSNLPVPLIPLDLQKEIVKKLKKLDELIYYNESSMILLDDYIKGVFFKMFGDINLNPNGWRISKISDLTYVKTGKTPSRKNNDYWNKSEVPWVKTAEVNGTYIFDTLEYISKQAVDENNLNIFPKDTILVAMYGQGKTRGQCGILKIESTTNQACACILPSENFNPEFLYYYLTYSYEKLRALGRGGNQPNLNLNLVKTFEVYVPPIELQNKFARIVQQVEEIKKYHLDSKSELEKLFNNLMQKSFKEAVKC